jgi:uncharacterized protein YceH (UPF0502 family)
MQLFTGEMPPRAAATADTSRRAVPRDERLASLDARIEELSAELEELRRRVDAIEARTPQDR